nr:dynein regulatory complex subunit 5 [Nothobranchius furzeri]XP_054604023.1 dynein regulatory complex subunit 5 [Nothobranchius furzeri]
MSRRIIAEDTDWLVQVTDPLRLSHKCLQCIVENFEVAADEQIFTKITPFQKCYILERLSVSLPFHVTSKLVPDGVYWEKCCKHRWYACDVTDYDNSWKQMYIERHLGSVIELFIPGVTEPKTVLEIIPFCDNFVKKLSVSQLLPPLKEPQVEVNVEELSLDEPCMDHFDFGLVLDKLTNLEELHVVYRIKQCGLNFERKMQEMTDGDCISLANAVKSSKTLKVLRLPVSCINDEKCCMLMYHLMDFPILRELDLSHNMIGKIGGCAIAKLLIRSKLEVLKMYNNRIGDVGSSAIAEALSKNPPLSSLDLRMNEVGDKGGEAIFKALQKNNVLLRLHMGSNGLTSATVPVLSDMLKKNETLSSLDLSGNKLDEGGILGLKTTMFRNKIQKELELAGQRKE